MRPFKICCDLTNCSKFYTFLTENLFYKWQRNKESRAYSTRSSYKEIVDHSWDVAFHVFDKENKNNTIIPFDIHFVRDSYFISCSRLLKFNNMICDCILLYFTFILVIQGVTELLSWLYVFGFNELFRTKSQEYLSVLRLFSR